MTYAIVNGKPTSMVYGAWGSFIGSLLLIAGWLYVVYGPL